MALIGSITNYGSLQGDINNFNGSLTGYISSSELMGGQVVGMRGLPGEAATITVGSTTTGGAGTSASVVNSGTSNAAVLDFTIPKGDTGATGKGIASISKTSTAGLVDTYTITYDDGYTSTFTVTNGADGYTPTANVSKAGDTATITITDENGTTTASITDGTDGTNGVDGYSPIANVSKVSDTATITITDENGTTTASVKDGTNGTNGVDGYSPIANVSKVGDTATITITDENGTTTASVKDGTDGTDGYSPSASVSKVGDTATITITDENGTTTATVSDGADGVVQDVEVNGTSVLSGTVAEVTVPTKTSDLNNDSKFITSPNIPFLTCATAAATAAKTTTLVSGSFTEADLVAGAQVLVKFTNANGKASPTLSVNGTTAKTIYRYGTTAPSTSAASSWNAGSVILFTYDGSYWQMTGYLNTTYSEISEANITNATGSSTGLASGRRVKKAVETFAPVLSVNGATGAVTTHDVPSGGSSGQALTKNSNDDYDLTWTNVGGGSVTDVTQNGTSVLDGTVAKVITHDVPSGGTSGQVLAKDSNTDYDLTWTTPSAGSVTDVKQNGTSVLDGTVAKVVTHDIPSGGAGGQFLVKNTGTNYDVAWTTLNVGVTGVLVNGTSVVESGVAKVLVPVSDVEVNGSSVVNAGVASVTVPTVNNATLTIQKNSTNVATFTANASSNVTADISVPTNVSDLNNDSGFITGVTSTSTPTASTISEFDANAKMNSTDMTTGSGGEVETFVNSLNVTGINAVDYIVEQGTNGDWTYRKWHSGVVEAWVSNLDLGSQTPAVWVSPVRYKDMTFSIPSGIFANTPTVTATSATTQWWVGKTDATSATSVSARFVTLASSSASVVINVYARG